MARIKSQQGIFWGVSSFQTLAMFRRGLFYAYLSVYLRYYLGLSVTETTLFATLPMILNIVAQTFVWGRISDRYQLRRTLILWGEFLGGLGTLIVWYLHTLPLSSSAAGYVIIIGLSLTEFFWAMSNIGWSALISDLYPQAQRSTVQGRLASIGALGRILGVWLGGLLYDGMGLEYEGWGFYEGSLFFVAAGVMFLSMIPMAFMPEGGIRPQEDDVQEQADQRASVRLFWIFLVAMTFINFGRNSVVIIQSQYLFLDAGFDINSRMLSYVVNTESLAIVLVGFIAGRIGSCLGNGRAVCLGAVCALSYLAIYILATDLEWIFVGSFLKGSSEVILLSASYAFASVLIPPQSRGRLFSLFNATLFLSWGIGATLIAGPLTDGLIAVGKSEIFSYQMAYLSAIGMTGIGLLIQGVLVFVLVPRSSVGKNPANGL